MVWYAFGAHILPPSHTGWMLTGTIGPDPVQYWLGFTFFKRSPWMWPPGLNPAYGMELGSSIFYADAIPLLAFLFKALHPVLEISQYWGLWLFACGALQGVLALAAARPGDREQAGAPRRRGAVRDAADAPEPHGRALRAVRALPDARGALALPLTGRLAAAHACSGPASSCSPR